jgi:porphobilinogen deaminase
VEIRGNVPTRLQKLADQPEIDATLLATAGLGRLRYLLGSSGRLKGAEAPPGLAFTILSEEEMLPCVGQGAIGLEIREGDERMEAICKRLNDEETMHCVTAERALLRAIDGGCQTPLGAYACMDGKQLHLRAVSFLTDLPRRADARAPIDAAVALGQRIAARLI